MFLTSLISIEYKFIIINIILFIVLYNILKMEKNIENPHLRDIHILIVDDEKSITRLIEIQLRRMWYENITIRNSWEDWLDAFNKSPDLYSVVISDFKMLGINWIEFLGKIKLQKKEIITILISWSDIKDFSSWFEWHVDHFISKIDFEESSCLSWIELIWEKLNNIISSISGELIKNMVS